MLLSMKCLPSSTFIKDNLINADRHSGPCLFSDKQEAGSSTDGMAVLSRVFECLPGENQLFRGLHNTFALSDPVITLAGCSLLQSIPQESHAKGISGSSSFAT